MHVLKNRASNYTRQNLTELHAETHEYISIVKTLIPLSIRNRQSRHTVNKNKVNLNNTINLQGIIGIYKLLHPTTAEKHSSQDHKIDHRLNHKTHLKILK